jgi:hypothetical protein
MLQTAQVTKPPRAAPLGVKVEPSENINKKLLKQNHKHQ